MLFGEWLEYRFERRYTFSERDGVILYGDLAVFDVRPQQPEINLYTVRFLRISMK